jgi:TatD DNase family protein
VIDTHCHLTFPDFQADAMPGGVAGVLERASQHGVGGCITISTTTANCEECLSVAARFPSVWCSAGVHPLYAGEGPHEWHRMLRVGQHERCVAWGELGLDNHYEQPARALQREVLDEQLAHIQRWHAEGLVAVKPVILHCREAFADLIPVLERTKLDPARCVFHCFTGNAVDMRRILDFGACVSFTGVVTYKNASDLREAAKLPPLGRIMVETDAPFLAPHPHRSVRPCEPWMTSLTAKALAELRGVAWPEFHAILNDNTRRFFGVS